MLTFSEFRTRGWGGSLEALESRLSLSRIIGGNPVVVPISDPSVPAPPEESPDDPPPPPEPSPGPFPGTDPPIVYPPPPLGGPVGPA